MPSPSPLFVIVIVIVTMMKCQPEEEVFLANLQSSLEEMDYQAEGEKKKIRPKIGQEEELDVSGPVDL